MKSLAENSEEEFSARHGTLPLSFAAHVSVTGFQLAVAFLTTAICDDDHSAASEHPTTPHLPRHQVHFYRKVLEPQYCFHEYSSRFLQLMGEFMEVATFLDIPAMKLFVRSMMFLGVVEDAFNDILG